MPASTAAEESSSTKPQFERFSSGSNYGSRHKLDRPPQYDKIHYDQMSQCSNSRSDKKQLVSEAVDKIYDRAQFEEEKTTAASEDKFPTEKFPNDRFSASSTSRYDKIPRGSLSKTISETASFRDYAKDKYERLEKGRQSSRRGAGSSGRVSRSSSMRDGRLSSNGYPYPVDVCRCSAMGGRPHLHRNIEEKEKSDITSTPKSEALQHTYHPQESISRTRVRKQSIFFGTCPPSALRPATGFLA